MTIDRTQSSAVNALLALARKPQQTGAAQQVAATAAPQPAATNTTTAFDFTQTTPRNMLDIINTLITSGQVTLDETSSLVPFMGSTSLVEGQGEAGWADQPVNYFDVMAQVAEYSRYSHNQPSVEYAEKAIAMLNRFQGQLSGVNLSV